ncbi:MAG: DUF5320 domain-containing protein [Candidatus Woesearchaeota archaeon]
MPNKDKTGPEGMGPMTGRGLGPCGSGQARGFGRGQGRGMGYRRMGFRQVGFAQPVELTKEQENKILEAEKAELEAKLESIKKKLFPNKKVDET